LTKLTKYYDNKYIGKSLNRLYEKKRENGVIPPRRPPFSQHHPIRRLL